MTYNIHFQLGRKLDVKVIGKYSLLMFETGFLIKKKGRIVRVIDLLRPTTFEDFDYYVDFVKAGYSDDGGFLL